MIMYSLGWTGIPYRRVLGIVPRISSYSFATDIKVSKFMLNFKNTRALVSLPRPLFYFLSQHSPGLPWVLINMRRYT